MSKLHNILSKHLKITLVFIFALLVFNFISSVAEMPEKHRQIVVSGICLVWFLFNFVAYLIATKAHKEDDKL